MNPNAAIDKTVVVNAFRLNVIQRPEQVLAFPGGKGCNVARALKTLGERPVVGGWVGGFAGQFIETGLQSEGIGTAFIHTDFESRTCLSILDPVNNTLTELYEKGDSVPVEKVAEFEAFFRAHVTDYEAVTFSGSLPPGVPLNFYRDMIAIAHEAKVPVLLDSSGEALRQGVTAKPLLVKPNETELADLAGKAPQDQSGVAQAARELSFRYDTLVVISIGPDGAIAANRDQIWHIQPPQVTIKSAVGSGDSTLAGITFGLTRGFAFEDAVKYGVAAGTANALTVGAGHFSVADFENVLGQVTVERL
ncbi:MAG: 1-phosphofructokinase family hexose kinase [Thermoflexales bacterium]|nr:1-phosphofructokinase family hexose kinase [Thermoflexales bacterium]